MWRRFAGLLENEELGRMWKKVAVAYYKVPSPNLPGDNEED
jgi:hypothetical protein